MVVNRKKLNKEFIQNNPKLSGNKCYQYARIHGFGINKSNFYKLFREIKNLPQPSKEKQLQSIPTKYKTEKHKQEIKEIKKTKELKEIRIKKIRKIKIDKKRIPFPRKVGTYGIVEIHDKKKKESKWIKFYDQQDLDRQLDIIDESDEKKGFGIIAYEFIYHGQRKLTEFIDEEFRELLA